jgi:hypothetical protein
VLLPSVTSVALTRKRHPKKHFSQITSHESRVTGHKFHTTSTETACSPVAPSGHSPEREDVCSFPLESVART